MKPAARSALAHRPDAIQLTEDRRRVAEGERSALDHLRNGAADTALDLYAEHDRLHITPGATEPRPN